MTNSVKRPNRDKPGYLHSLDGWRAVAILGVLLYHDHVHRLGYVSTSIPHAVGYMGVELFFGISGLLITTRILDEERKLGGQRLGAFYIRRAFRILPPALFLLMTLIFLHLIFGLPLVMRGVMWTLLFVRNFLYPNTLAGLKQTEHFWSLSVEEQFYLFMPAFLFLIRSRVVRLVSLFLAAFFFFSVTYFSTRRYAQYYPAERGHATELHLHTILIGCGLAVLITLPRVRSWASRLLTPTVWIPVCLLLAIAIAYGFGHKYLPLFVTTALPFVVLGTVLRPEHWITRLFEWSPLRFIGRMSYSLYLWQQLFMVVANEAAGSSWAWLGRFPVNYLATFACAAFSFYVIEKPLIRVGHKLATSKQTVVLPVAQEYVEFKRAV